MTDLTEQWKKGELPYGRYYVELAYNGNNIIMADYWWDKALTLDDHEYSREEVKRILAPVPSYKEWQAKDKENNKLKELLREWIQFEIEENPNDFTVISERMSGLANKTNQAIGEK